MPDKIAFTGILKTPDMPIAPTERGSAAASLHVLPAPLDAEACARHVATLTRALQAGTDLGTREHHIRDQITLLHYLVQTLQLETEKLASDQSLSFPGKDQFIAICDRVAEAAECLIGDVRHLNQPQ